MIKTKGYAAQDPNSDLASWDFERRGRSSWCTNWNYVLWCMSFGSASNKNDWFPGLFPMVPGHEIVGKIVKVGDHVKTLRLVNLQE